MARASRIFVEGRHDAELVEKVWGDDLRIEGVVVEYLDGVDDLAERLREFGPGPSRRVGVLVDHLVRGSKESRIADAIAKSPVGRHVLIVGHPFIDIWAAVKPERLGLRRWPDVPRSIEWKKGICQQLGWPHRDQADIARAWQHILGKVVVQRPRPGPAGRVEELIDFVTSEEAPPMSEIPPPPSGEQPARRPAAAVRPPPGPRLGPGDERTWATAAHWSALVAACVALAFLGPLVVLLAKGNESPWVRRNAVESLNFQLSMLIYGFAGTPGGGSCWRS